MTQPIDILDPLNIEGADELPTGFDANAYQWMQHLKLALKELPVKQRIMNYYWRYYDGEHPQVWMNDGVRKLIRENKLDVDSFIENWCETVIDKPLTRIEATGWEEVDKSEDSVCENVAAIEDMKEVFKHNDLDLGQTDLYRHVRVAGEGFVMVWKDKDNESGYKVTVQDPRWVYWPKGRSRNKPEFCVLLFEEDELGAFGIPTGGKVWRATVYYSHVVVRLIGPKVSPGIVPSAARYFRPDPVDPGGKHGFEHVPVVRFSLFDVARSMLKNIVGFQDQCNKLKANKMVIAEWLAAPLLVAMTKQKIRDLTVRPNRLMVLDPGGGEDGEAPTSMWQSTPADLAKIDDAINKEIQKIWTKASLPRHVLVDTNSPVSGDAIEADEGDYVEMLEQHLKAFGASWTDVANLCGIEVAPTWRAISVKSDKSEMETVKLAKDAGVLLPEALIKYASWSQDEVDTMFKREATVQEASQVVRNVGNAVALGADPEAGKAVTDRLGGKAAQVTAPPQQPPSAVTGG